MKQTKKYSIMGLAALGMGMLVSSCTNELSAPGASGGVSQLSGSPVVTPEFVAWSGDQTLVNNGTTIAAARTADGVAKAQDIYSGNAGNGQDVGQGQTNAYWAPFKNPTLVGDDEKEKVLAAIAVKTENGTKGYIHEEMVFPWENYFLQDVLRGVDSSCPSNSWLLYAYTTNTDNGFAMVTNSGQIDYHGVFMQSGSQVRADNTALMVNMGLGSYSDMVGRQFYFHMNCHENKDWFDSYIVVESEGNYYICVDFACVSEDHDNGNEMRYHDWDYNDWIIKISPAIPVNSDGSDIPEPWTGENDNVNPDPEPDQGENGPSQLPTPDQGDDNNDGDDNTGNDNPGNGNTGNGNNDNVTYLVNDEVEINLALNDIHTLPNGSQKYDVADLVSKLSLHVRYSKDVEVILPVPEKFYCNQDDLYILQTHADGDFIYGGESHSVNYTLGDNGEYNVTLTVEFVSALQDVLTSTGEGYIRVYTEGIDRQVNGKTVVDYCKEVYGDGINFEVYNYYNRGTQYSTGSYAEIGYDELQFKYLSRSLVNFDWTQKDFSQKVYPDFYINAFNEINSAPNQGDCYVWIMGDHRVRYNSFNGLFSDGGLYEGSVINWSSSDLNQTNVEKNYFWNAYQGTHLNGSLLNWIYTAKNVTGSADPSKNAMPDSSPWPFTDPYNYKQAYTVQ